MTFPKYKYLLTFRYAEMICDLGIIFSRKFYLSDLPVRRTVEQFTQALRSGKQNIIEGVSEIVSLKSQIKLLGVATASFEEAIADLEDFLRQKSLKIWPKTDPQVADFRGIGYRFSNLNNLSDLDNLEEATNFLLTLLHIETFLLFKQVKSAENKFLSEGGYTENLFKKRLNFRQKQDY